MAGRFGERIILSSLSSESESLESEDEDEEVEVEVEVEVEDGDCSGWIVLWTEKEARMLKKTVKSGLFNELVLT